MPVKSAVQNPKRFVRRNFLWLCEYGVDSVMRILLTGATGFLGNHLLQQLIEAGHQVTATLRHSSDPRPMDGLDVSKVVVDLNEPSEISPLIGQHDAVIHAAAMIHLGWSKIPESRKVNAGGTKTLAESARRYGIRMVHVSTVDALGEVDPAVPGDETRTEPPKPACAYVVSKREAEAVFLDEVRIGLDGVIVNPGFMVGPRDWKPSSGEMLLTIAKQFMPLAPAGGCSVADVRDVARGIVLALDRGVAGERYILGGHDVTYLELWTQMAKVAGRRPPIGKLPNWISKIAGAAGDLAGRFTSEEPQLNSAVVAMGQLHHWYSSDKAINQLGYHVNDYLPALEESWEWFKQHGYV